MDYDLALTETLKTYEQTAPEYLRTHSDINEIKACADKFVKLLSGRELLDIGCGSGRDARYFSQQGLKVTGIDLCSNFLQLASNYAPHATFLNMDMRNLSFSNACFDGLWACASFLHLPKSEALQTLQGFHRVLKPSGILYLSLQVGEGEQLVQKSHYSQGKKFFAYYSAAEVEQLIPLAGFKIIETFVDPKLPKWLSVYAVKE